MPFFHPIPCLMKSLLTLSENRNKNSSPLVSFSKFLIFLSFFLICSSPLQAQFTAEEWLAEAEKALAEGRHTDAGSAYSNAAHKLNERGDHEEAAKNFEKAAEQFDKDGRTAQSNVETTNAATAYEAAADKAAREGNHAKAAELYDKAAEQYDADERTSMAEGARAKAASERSVAISYNTTATGNTSGNVANIVITNSGNQASNVTIPAGIIPSNGSDQGYVVPTPVVVSVPSNGTTTVSVNGYCINPDLPAPGPGTVLSVPTVPSRPSNIVTVANRIIDATDRLIEGDDISTPFDNADQGRDVLIQYTIWTAVPDQPIKPGDLCDRIIQDYVTTVGKPLSDLTPAERIDLDYGTIQITDAVSKIGTEAGLPDFATPTIPPSATPVIDAPVSTHPQITNTIKITGTGNTTGHVANLTVSNPTDNPVTVSFGDGPVYIPEENGQPLSIPQIPAIPLAPGETKTVPIEGYCADIHVPPVGNGLHVTNHDRLMTPGTGTPATPTPGVVQVPMKKVPPAIEVSRLLSEMPHGTSPAPAPPCPDATLIPMPLIPGTGNVLQTPLDPKQNPGAAVPLMLDALSQITQSYDQLRSEGKISTPFGANPAKERESVIQQTYWIYTSALTGEPYMKTDFKSMTDRQFEKNTGKKAEELPPAELIKYAEGVDDFWNTFSVVGVESKILTPTPVIPAPSTPDSGFDKIDPKTMKPGTGTSKPKGTTADDRRTTSEPTEAPTLIKDDNAACSCGDITVKIKVWEMERQPDGSFKSVGSSVDKTATASGDKNAAPHEIKVGKKNLKNGVRIGVDLESVTMQCPCSDGSKCDIFKDANEAKAYDDAVKARDKVIKDNADALAKAEEDYAKAKEELEDESKKQGSTGFFEALVMLQLTQRS